MSTISKLLAIIKLLGFSFSFKTFAKIAQNTEFVHHVIISTRHGSHQRSSALNFSTLKFTLQSSYLCVN